MIAVVKLLFGLLGLAYASLADGDDKSNALIQKRTEVAPKAYDGGWGQEGAEDSKGGTTTDRLKQRDSCPRDHIKPIELVQSQPWNVTAELPRDLFMKHAGWAPDGSDRGIGVYTARSFKQGENVGTALARLAACVDEARVETPMGLRAITCDIHFFDLPPVESGSFAEDLAVFPSWMSFLNAPDDEDEAGLAIGGSVDWGASVCSHPSGAPQWRLVASRDLAPQEELTLVYDGTDEDKEEDAAGNHGRMMMRKMKAVVKKTKMKKKMMKSKMMKKTR